MWLPHERAGADQADALAVRSVSLSVEVRDGAVEESERSEGDDLGLRVIVGHKQAVVSTNDLKGDGFDALAERAVAMARAAPEDRFAGLADASQLAQQLPALDLIDPDMPDVDVLEARAREAEAAGLAVPGVTKSGGASASAGIGGLVLVTSHGFHGATIASRHGISMTAIAGDGTGMERDYDFSSTLHASDLEGAQAIGRRAGERAVKRLNPRKVATRRVPVVFDCQDFRLAGRPPGQRRQWQLGGAQDEFPAGKTRRRKSSLPASTSSTIRCGRGACAHGRSTPKASPAARVTWSRMACSKPGFSIARPRASSTWKPPATPNAASPRPPRPGQAICIWSPAAKAPDELIADIEDGFYVTDMIGMGVNLVTGDYSRGASGFWIENGERTYPVSEVTIAGHLSDMFASLVPANDLVFRFGTNAPTLRVEGMTVAGH